jgi:hypothetical protein
MENVLNQGDHLHLAEVWLQNNIRVTEGPTAAQVEQLRRIQTSDRRYLGVIIEDDGSTNGSAVNFRHELVEAFASNRCLKSVDLCPTFLSRLDEESQKLLFHHLLNISSLDSLLLGRRYCQSPDVSYPVFINAFTEALRDASLSLHYLRVIGFRIDSLSTVKKLAEVLEGQSQSLETLILEAFISTDKLGSINLIARAASNMRDLRIFHVACHPFCEGPSRLGENALRTLLMYKNVRNDGIALTLEGMRLTDSACWVIAETISDSKSCSVDRLSLRNNPAMRGSGYDILLHILNRPVRVLMSVDDETYNSKFRLVEEMNRLGRLQALKNGVFASKKHWIDWIGRLSVLDTSDATVTQVWAVNAIFYTLLEKPDYI